MEATTQKSSLKFRPDTSQPFVGVFISCAVGKSAICDALICSKSLKMESESSSDTNPLRIVEDEAESETKLNLDPDKSDDSDSNEELFDFSASDIEELQGDGGKRRSLLIIEDKDLMMDDVNNNNNLHRLSLQVESGDDNSLVMTNEAINRTIIRIGSRGSSVDFGESEGNLIDKPHEAINHGVETANFAGLDDGAEAIVTILGQINDIVGSFVSCLVCKREIFCSISVSVANFLCLYRLSNLTFLLFVIDKIVASMTHQTRFVLFSLSRRQKHGWQRNDKPAPKHVKFVCENWIDSRRSWSRMPIESTTCISRKFCQRLGHV